MADKRYGLPIGLKIFLKKQRKVPETKHLIIGYPAYISAVICGHNTLVKHYHETQYFKIIKFQKMAIKFASIFGRSYILKLLIKLHRKNLYYQNCKTRLRFLTVTDLYKIIKFGHQSVFEQLSKLGLPINSDKQNNNFALTLAKNVLKYNHFEFYYVLIEKYLNNMFALRLTQFGYLKGLITNNNELTKRSEDRIHCLFPLLSYNLLASIAVSCNKFSAVKKLSKKNNTISIGVNYLAIAIKKGYYDIAKFVIENFTLHDDYYAHANCFSKNVHICKLDLNIILNEIIYNNSKELLYLIMSKYSNKIHISYRIVFDSLIYSKPQIISILLNHLKQDITISNQIKKIMFRKIINFSKYKTNNNERNHRIIYAIMINNTYKYVRGDNNVIYTNKHTKDWTYDEIKRRKRRNRRRSKRNLIQNS